MNYLNKIEPIFLVILFLFIFVSALLFFTFSYFLYKDIQKIQSKLGEKVFNWLLKE